MSVPKICFCAIFRNESKNVYRCLDSAKPLIDFVYICDTGSTDNTIELVKKWGLENNIKTHVDTKEFRDFGFNRTYSYRRAVKVFNRADYFLFLDADMIFKLGPKWTDKSIFTDGAYHFKQVNKTIIYDNIRLVKRNPRIKCVGVTHEYWDLKGATLGRIGKEILYIDDIGDGGHKQDKYERDKDLLEKAIYKDEEVGPNLRGRYFFYLARTYSCIKKNKLAIQIYLERIKYPCPEEEIYYSYYQIGVAYQAMDKMEKALFYYSKAWQTRPTRAESIYKMAEYYTFNSKEYHLAVMWAERGKNITMPNDSLFVEHKNHTYGFSYILSIAYFYIGEKEKGGVEIKKLMSMSDQLPVGILNSTKKNAKFYK